MLENLYSPHPSLFFLFLFFFNFPDELCLKINKLLLLHSVWIDGGENEKKNWEILVLFGLNWSERGSQRERDRERAQARATQKSKHPKNDGLTPEQRRERFFFILSLCFFFFFAISYNLHCLCLYLTKFVLCDWRDAKALQEKAARKAAQGGGGNNAGGGFGGKKLGK